MIEIKNKVNKTQLFKELTEIGKNRFKFTCEPDEDLKVFLDGAEQLFKLLRLPDVVVELPNVKSKEFKRWTQSKGYEPAFNGLWYEKNSQTYKTELLHRAFTNEIEFGN